MDKIILGTILNFDILLTIIYNDIKIY